MSSPSWKEAGLSPSGEALVGKWKLELLFRLSLSPARWNELTRCFPAIAPNVLTRQLRQLEQAGLVQRAVSSPKPPRAVEYDLTERGRQYVPFLQALRDWEMEYTSDMGGIACEQYGA